MIEQGIVLECKNGRAKVQMDGGADATRCASCGCCKRDADNRPVLRIATHLPVQPGDRVEVQVDVPNAAIASFVVFGIPLLCILLGGGIGYLHAPAEDGALILGGLAGLVAGFGLVALLARILPGLGKGTRIQRVLTQHDTPTIHSTPE